MENAKIIVVYHKKSTVVNDPIFIPIHVGKQSDDLWYKDKMIADSIGDNISDLNPTYNELTAIYWVYKNYELIGNPKFIGLSHYRRFFIFEERKYPYYEELTIDDSLKNKIKIDNFDLITAGIDFIAPMTCKRKTVYDNYAKSHHVEDINLALSIINAKFPHMAESAISYSKSSGAYFYNMFVFDKQTFFNYCEFMFSIIDDFVAKTKYPNERLFISEFITGVYFTYLISVGKKPLHLPVLSFYSKPNFKEAIKATKLNFKENNASFLYKLKPILVWLIPNKILLIRKRKTNN